MPRWLRIALKVLASIVGVVVGLVACLLIYIFATSRSPKIVDFNPTTAFTAKADGPFFYAVDGKLKFGDTIDSAATTLLEGEMHHVVVAPDNKSALVVVNDTLFLVAADGSGSRSLTPVGSIYGQNKPVMVRFTRDDGFQWSRDSKRVYAIRDVYSSASGSPSFSEKGELWVVELATDKPARVLAPFRAHDYALGANDGVYFTEPTGDGDLMLKHFDGDTVRELGRNQKDYQLAGVDTPFYSFRFDEYDNVVAARNVRLNRITDTEQVIINDKVILTTTRGKDVFRGKYYCSTLRESAFLPGHRFFLLNPTCDNYSGSMLIDVTTGKYKTLPGKTRVYPVVNTDTYPRENRP